MGEADLPPLRERIAQIDEQILKLIAERLEASVDVAEAKKSAGIPIRNFQVEVEVLGRARRAAQKHGFDEELAQRVLRELIEASVSLQSQHNQQRSSSAKRILVVGGAGRMGRWLGQFFLDQGHQVESSDPSLPDSIELEAGVAGADIVALATPLVETPAVLQRVLACEQRPLVFDICSLKADLIPILRQAARAGHRVTSLHPMFGPGPTLLSGQTLLVCDAGNKQATAEARALFAHSALGLCDLPIEQHDRVMAVVLGMSHAINLVFALTLARFGLPMEVLGRLSSSTFARQIQTTAQVAGENPSLYHQIQHLNRHTPGVYVALSQSLGEFCAAATRRDEEYFVQLMTECREFFKLTEAQDG